MASTPFYHDIDLVRVGQITNVRKHNISTVDRVDLGDELDTSHIGLFVWDVDEGKGYTWNGTEWISDGVEIEGSVVFKGVVDASTSLDTQAEAVTGYEYVVTTAGNLTMTGVTFSPSPMAELGDRILFTSDTQAYVVQANDVQATETVLGNVRLATQPEVNAGANDTAAVTPLKLQTKLTAQQYVRGYSASVNLVANTPLTVTHNLNLTDRNAFTASAVHNNQIVQAHIESVNANIISVTSSVSLTGVRINVFGFSA